MRLHFCNSDGNRQVVHGDMVLLYQFLVFILPLLNEIIVSVDKNPLGLYNDPLFQNCCKYGRQTSFKPW